MPFYIHHYFVKFIKIPEIRISETEYFIINSCDYSNDLGYDYRFIDNVVGGHAVGGP